MVAVVGTEEDFGRFLAIPQRIFEEVSLMYGGLSSLEFSVRDARVRPLVSLGLIHQGTPLETTAASLVLETFNSTGGYRKGGRVSLFCGKPTTVGMVREGQALVSVSSVASAPGWEPYRAYELRGTVQFFRHGFDFVGGELYWPVIIRMLNLSAELHQGLPHKVVLGLTAAG